VNPEVVPPAATTFTGTFIVKFSIMVKSAIATTTPILCQVDASVVDQSTTTLQVANEIEETASLGATRGTGTASCTVTIPYSWLLSFGSTDTVTLSYILAAEGTGVATSALVRTSAQDIARIPVPKTGTTTNESVSATL
jgi:hypothetical protein